MPVPGVWSLDSFNLRLPGRCLELGDKDHYRKGESQTGLFDEDRKALLPLPAKPFDVVTWTRMKADKYGNVTVQGRHRYAAGPEHAGHEMIVGLRALEVEILDAEGKRVITHPRSYGDKPTDSGDRRASSGCCATGRRPGATAGCATRCRPASRMDRRAGRGHAARQPACPAARRRRERLAGGRGGMLEILESTGGADRAGVCLAAARHASGLGPVAYDDPVDLSEYDIAYTKEDE